MILLLILLFVFFRFLVKKLILVAGIMYSLSGSTILFSSILSMLLTGSYDNIIFLIVSIFQIILGVILIFAYSAIKKSEFKKESQEQQSHEEYRVEISPEFEKWYEQYKKQKGTESQTEVS